jgi:hypothetical protein
LKRLNIIIIFSWFIRYTSVSHPQRTILTAFRGSVDFENWLADFTFFTTDYPLPSGARNPPPGYPETIKVHSGFLTVWSSVRNDYRRLVRDLVRKYPGYDVTLTGHSLGGGKEIQKVLTTSDRSHERLKTFV